MVVSKQKKQNAPDWLFENITEASKNARSIFILYVGSLAYCVLTVFTTPDERIFFNQPARLPIINLDVSFNGFVILAPLLIIFLFIYFQLYLNKLKRLVDKLKSDYAPEEMRVYPWMINFADELESGLIGKSQRFIVNFTLWWFLPGILMLLAFWNVKKQDPVLSYLLGFLPIIGTFIVITFWNHYEPSQDIFKSKSKVVLAFTVLLFEIFLLVVVIPRTLNGTFLEIDLRGYKFTEGINLKGARLAGADLRDAILKRADLRGADLRHVNLEGATLTRADLSGANLEGANLHLAILDTANLSGLDLRQVNLEGAKLKGANLQRVDLRGTVLRDADLRFAHLDSANLEGANLRLAILDTTNLSGLDLRRVNLEGAKLRGANLQGVNLRGAVLRDVDLRFADLDSADLGGGNITFEVSSTQLNALKRNLSDLRADPDRLSHEAVDTMIVEKGFFDIRKNPSGGGFSNWFELQKNDSVIVDNTSGLMWQRSGSVKLMSYDQTKTYIDSLNENNFANYSNWRLPTLEEAMSLMESQKADNGLYIAREFDNKQPWIWTSDKSKHPTPAWVVLFTSGYCDGTHVNFRCYVRAVR